MCVSFVQGWSCCKKRTTDFSEFLSIKVTAASVWEGKNKISVMKQVGVFNWFWMHLFWHETIWHLVLFHYVYHLLPIFLFWNTWKWPVSVCWVSVWFHITMVARQQRHCSPRGVECDQLQPDLEKRDWSDLDLSRV